MRDRNKREECIARLRQILPQALKYDDPDISDTASNANDPGTKAYNDKIADLENYPHLFVLSCMMDTGMNSDKAWIIPYKVAQELLNGDLTFPAFASLSEDAIVQAFEKGNFHRYKTVKGKVFYSAIRKIANEYDGDASAIWGDNPDSSLIISRFLEFDGCGIKIATMATNLLYRNYKVPMSNLSSIEVSPDVHVRRIFYRTGLVNSSEVSESQIIYAARFLNPDYPGIVDRLSWLLGKTKICTDQAPKCDECPLRSACYYAVYEKG